MGHIRLGIPQDLAIKLRDTFGLRYFIETGTYKGGTAKWALQNFKKVWTIEGWPEYWEKAHASFGYLENINCLFGDSRDLLPKVLEEVGDEPALLWLDAHWLGNSVVSAGTPGECALKEELEAIKKSGVQHFVLIDDAHCFQGELPREADRSQWPPLSYIRNFFEEL
jgi:hypothetical protein